MRPCEDCEQKQTQGQGGRHHDRQCSLSRHLDNDQADARCQGEADDGTKERLRDDDFVNIPA
jgi:hypothetical protein